MPLFLQIALGIVGGVFGLILLFNGPRVINALFEHVMHGNIFQMMSKGMILLSLPLMTIMIVKLFKAISHPEVRDKIISEPASLAGMVALALGVGLLFVGEKLENRAKKNAETETRKA